MSKQKKEIAPLPYQSIDYVNMKEITLDEVATTLSLTIKNDTDNKLITFLCMLSAYTEDSQINISFNAPSASGKTYTVTEVAKLFPKEDKIELSGASPTSFFYGESKVDKKRKAKIVTLGRKILILSEQSNSLLQAKLRPLLSHDSPELKYRITNKDKKGSNRAELIILEGFPATIFCSASMQLDEQETTRAILLSPEITEAKLRSGVYLQARRGANQAEFDSWLESQPERIALVNRILAIRDQKITHVIVPNYSEVDRRFRELLQALKPRHMRDMGHLMKLIKVIALLNVWHRKQSDGTVLANQSDIDQGFKLWEKFMESQDLNVPPVVMDFYKNYVVPAYEAKKSDPDLKMAILAGEIGLSRHELSNYYLHIEQTTLNEDVLRKQILPQLENSGLIIMRKPDYGDRRSIHIYPQAPIKQIESENNIGQGGGTVDTGDEEYRQFFK